MPLDYLDFDFSEDSAGHGTFDAMAAVAPAQFPALEAEIVRVLHWAAREFGEPAPLDEGGAWDYQLQAVQEVATALDVRLDPQGQRLQLEPRTAAPARLTLTLTVSGAADFCDAFRAAFGIE
jgi:hypothetical protein